jgi:Holliday junction resolvasome RuvABC ATP-dependent DNA helicase subunit
MPPGSDPCRDSRSGYHCYRGFADTRVASEKRKTGLTRRISLKETEMTLTQQKRQQALKSIIDEVSRVVVGKDDIKELMLLALLSQGHILIEGLPGTAKTTIARTFARAIGGTFKRVQGTPDLLPSDILGFYLTGPTVAPR